jgi:hypothetical protein
MTGPVPIASRSAIPSSMQATKKFPQPAPDNAFPACLMPMP